MKPHTRLLLYHLMLPSMAIRVVEFSNGGYKIRKNFARNNEKKNTYLDHQMLGRRVVWPIDPATQRIILKID